MKITRQKGTKDIFGKEMEKWEYLQRNIEYVCHAHNINQIKTPVFEATELFARGVGDETDIVTKEMYTFTDKGDRSITLRPELTAGVVRAFVENGFSSMPNPVKLWYIGNMYRYEKMQKGRYREFSQFGIELFGSSSVKADVEAILIAVDVLKECQLLKGVTLKINSIGCKICREAYVEKMKEYLKDKLVDMCEDCNIRYQKNPMRIMDCKQEKCKKINENLPMITDYLCEECTNDFEMLKSMLTTYGIKYEVDKTIVRGLDYYNKTVFEFISNELGIAVGGGGRYDSLVEMLGGTPTPAVGFALGMDRLMLLLNDQEKYEDRPLKIYLAFDSMTEKVVEIIEKLRDRLMSVEMDICDRSFSAQLKYASKIGADYLLVIKEQELKENTCMIKNMKNSNQDKIQLDATKILEYVVGQIKEEES